MTTAAQNLLTTFDALAIAEQNAVIVELLRRSPVGDTALPDAAFEELAEEIFLSYDAAEVDDATPSH